MKKSLKAVFSVILTAAMLLTVMMPAFAASGSVSGRKSLSFEQVENQKGILSPRSAAEQLTEAQLKGDVRVSIVLSDKSTLENGFSTNGIASNSGAKNYRASLLAKQNALAQKISKEILHGKTLDVKWNLTLAANIISANVPAVAIAQIEALDEVERVVIETQYEPATAVESSAQPNMTNASYMTGATAAWANGYTGLGSKVAIIDTGLDTDHISFDADAFDYAVSVAGKDADLLTADEVAELYSQLNIAAALGDAENEVYLTSKVPFAANYVDSDLDVTHDNDREGEHGSHVAGIAAANRFIKEEDGTYSNALESVLTQGEAPDAQILVMKVFGKGGGAYDSDYMAAIEDAVVLGADSVNLSLGSAAAGFATDEVYQDILDNFQTYNTVVSISAGNAGQWADSSNYGVLFAEDNGFDTVGSPGSYANAFTVASVDNDGVTGAYLKVDGQLIFYSENLDYGNEAIASLAGDHEFIYVDSIGTEDDFAAVADVLEGKIAICNRGTISFFEKANAAVANGAIATVIANNQPGVINMNLTGYEYSAPAVSILLSDAEFIKAVAEAVTDEEGNLLYYTGEMTVGSDAVVNFVDDADYHVMSSFSSFGVPGDLSLKPEITAPGGNIYSVNGAVAGGEAYENMSGTSMAAPQIAGLSAIMAQYIRENDLEAKTGLTTRQLTQSLLMSTAEPLLDEYGYYYSVFQQGAGLVDIDSATAAKSYILMDDAWDYAADGKVKAELGDDPDRVGEYSVSFTVNNFSDEDVKYHLAYDFFTQYIYSEFIRYGDTDFIPAYVDWYIDGAEEPVDSDYNNYFDFNGDYLSNNLDITYLLDYIVGNVDEIVNEDYADFDGDGDIDTYDAYSILNYLCAAYIDVPAGESVEITADIWLPYGTYYDVNGNYVEGYLYVSEADSEDGAIGVVHSIPVLGYYGGWTESPMTGRGYYLDNAYDIENYTYIDTVQGFLVKYAGENGTYFFGGNPVLYEDEYIPERNSISSADSFVGVQSTLVKNIAGSRFTYTDENGENLTDPVYGEAKYGAYYYANQGTWQNTTTVTGANYSPAGLEDGDEINLTVTYAPEYYVNEDGEIDWNAHGEGASESITAYVDSTAPEIAEVYFEGYDYATGDWDSINIEASDNRYIAALVIYDDEQNILAIGDPDFEANEGAPYFFSVTKDQMLEDSGLDELSSRLLVEVYDYAMNLVTYKINLDVNDLSQTVSIVMPEEAVLVVNNSAVMPYSVEPWGVDETVIWNSSDETVATVNEAGIVTGIGEGECDITAVWAVDESVSATCHILVKYISKDLNAVVWDENGEIWFSEFNTSSLPYYNKLTEDSLNAAIASVAYGGDGNLYAVSFDSDEWVSDLYTVDPETFDLTRVGPSEIGYMDIAPEYSFGGNYLYAVYAYYIAIDTGGNYFVGIAFEETYIDEDDPTDLTDYYFLVDESGELYEIGIGPYNGSFGRTGLYDYGNLGYSSDTPYFSSLYFDGESLFWSRFNDSASDIIDWDASDTGEVFNLGSFAEGVWPAGGLFELEAAETEPEEVSEGIKALSQQELIADMAASVEPIEISGTSKGKLNAATDEENEVSVLDALAFVQTVELKAADDATNGFITVSYDAENFTLTGVRSSAAYSTYKDEDGVVTFAYVTTEGNSFNKDDVVATLTFDTNGTSDGEYVVTTEQINNDHLEDASETVTVSSAHTYGEPEFIWDETEEGFEAVLSVECVAHENCPENITVEAEVEVIAETEADCTNAATVTCIATAEYEGETYTEEKTFTVGEALAEGGHDIQFVASTATCSSDGEEAHYECSICGRIFADENGETELEAVPTAEKLGHDWDEGTVIVEPTCTEGGVLLITCKNDENHTKTQYIPSLGGHVIDEESYVEGIPATCTEEGSYGYYTCSVCGKYFADIDGEIELLTLVEPAAGHDWELVEIVEATCAEDGYRYYVCSVCGEELTETREALGHRFRVISATEPTCTEEGSIEYLVCRRCGETFAEIDGELVAVTEEDIIVPANGHTMIKTNRKEATCTADGNIEYYTCSVCGKVFADENGETEVTSTVIESTGHDWDNGTVLSPATCTEKGLMMFACNNDGSHVVFVAIDALGHSWKFVDAEEATCTEDGYENYICTVCGDTRTDVLAAIGHDMTYVEAVPATCTEDGTVAYYECAVCGLIFVDEEGEIELLSIVDPATGHTWELAENAEPTCTEEGYEAYVCTVCGEEKTEVIPAAGHTWELTEKVEATCTEDGSESYVCSVCGEEKTEVIPAAGHTWELTEKVEATCTEDGCEAYTCAVCDETKTEVITAAGHNLKLVEAVPATCTQSGSAAYYVCEFCSKMFADENAETEITDASVAALGHKLQKVEAVEPTAEAAGNIEYYKCSECGKLFADAEGTKELTEEDVIVPVLDNYMLGDVDLNGEISVVDARLALRCAVKLDSYEKDSANFINADINFSGEIEVSDARSILRAAVRLEDPASWTAAE